MRSMICLQAPQHKMQNAARWRHFAMEPKATGAKRPSRIRWLAVRRRWNRSRTGTPLDFCHHFCPEVVDRHQYPAGNVCGYPRYRDLRMVPRETVLAISVARLLPVSNSGGRRLPTLPA